MSSTTATSSRWQALSRCVHPLVHPLVVFAAMLVLYALTMPRTITLEDAGLFQMVCHLGGISHPPGYPLFTLLCQGIVRVPNVVNGNLVSAVFGALAVAMLYEVAWAIRPDRTFAYTASLAWGLTTTFWSQAIIIEVYTLAALLFMVCWWLTFRFVKTRNRRYWFALCLCYGLSLSNHWPLMLLSTMGIVATAWPALSDLLRRCRSPTFLAASLGLFILGLMPYVSLVLNPDPRIAVFGGIHSFDGFLHYVARAEYADSNSAAGLTDKIQYAGWLLRLSFTQLGIVGAPLVLLGLVDSFRTLRRSSATALVLVFLGSTYVLLMLLNFEYSAFFRAVWRPYPIVAFAAIAIWFALGVSLVAGVVRGIAGWIGWLVAPAALLAALMVNFPAMDRSDSHLVDDYLRTVLTTLPRDAVLFVQGDNETGPIGFLHYVEGVRPDVEVRDWDDLVFDNRLASPFASEKAQLRQFKAFIAATPRPVFLMDDTVSPRIDYGAYYQIQAKGADGYRFLPEFGVLVDMLVKVDRHGLVTDLHEQHFVFERLLQFSKQYVGYSLAHSHEPIAADIMSRLNELQRTFPGKLITMQQLVPLAADRQQKQLLLKLAAGAERQMPDFATPQSLAVFYELYGRVELMAPMDTMLAEKYFKKSIDAYPVRANTSICRLQALYRREGKANLERAITSRFAGLACGSPSGKKGHKNAS